MLHFNEILSDVLEKMYGVLEEEQRVELNGDDYRLIQKHVRRLTRECLGSVPSPELRFEISDRVVCRTGGDRPWVPGKVQALNELDPADPTGQGRLAYVVKVDPPNSRRVSVPRDSNDVVRPEVCFGQRAGALFFTRMCRPLRSRGNTPKRRFGEGERVACVVEDSTNQFTLWVAGTVTAVDLPLPETDSTQGGTQGGLQGVQAIVPYRVHLDTGSDVLVHRDEHWLVRDLALQHEGPCIGADGRRSLRKFSKRKVADGWEVIDHETRKVRRLQEVEDAENDEDGST